MHRLCVIARARHSDHISLSTIITHIDAAIIAIAGENNQHTPILRQYARVRPNVCDHECIAEMVSSCRRNLIENKLICVELSR